MSVIRWQDKFAQYWYIEIIVLALCLNMCLTLTSPTKCSLTTISTDPRLTIHLTTNPLPQPASMSQSDQADTPQWWALPSNSDETECTQSQLTRTRVDNLFNTLEEIKTDIKTRDFILQHQASDNGRYCQSCSPENKVGLCGPTCPLLRPADRRGAHPFPPYTNAQENENDHQLHAEMERVLMRVGYNIHPDNLDNLKQYEDLAAAMRSNGMNHSEHFASNPPYEVKVRFGKVDWEGEKTRDKEGDGDEEPLSPKST
jgi:hypothetical protein